MTDVFEKAVAELNLDRSDWQLVKFGDVAIQQKQTVDRENTELTRYVKGEHMYSEDIHLREWGELTDEYLGPAFIRKFEEGDILYGSRRTYLRKVVIAPFEGITSNTTFVIKANEEKIDKRLLPFIMLSEGFSQHSIKNSKGSVNPYVNWKDLAGYEFLLPSVEQQTFIADLFDSIDQVLEAEKSIYTRLNLNLEANIEAQIHGVELEGKTINQVLDELEKKIEVLPLNKLGKIFKGKGIAKSEVVETGLPCIRYGELYTKHHRIIRKYHSFITKESASKSIELKKGDVLLAGSGETISEIGKSASFIDEETVYAGSDIIIFRPDNMDERYLGYLMSSVLIRQQLNKVGTGATVMHIYGSDIEKIRVPIIGKNKQKEIGDNLEEIFSSITLVKSRENKTITLRKSLINQVF
ncbi:MAG: type I restriction enzyme S subunit [Pseudoalteromonas tetraodonis]|jgi:type I restriction enzyme S subunit|uniref:restriction endonuclease subunit S n=1 Tax=Pseudoalteromonas tetraodonis TaxID=43659 RepID=UPI003988FCC3